MPHVARGASAFTGTGFGRRSGATGATGEPEERRWALSRGGTTFGTVSVIKGTTLYVTDSSGNTVKVTTSPSSRVTKTTTATIALSGVQPGDTVVVRGTQQKNGNLAADTITLGGAGFGFGGRRRRVRTRHRRRRCRRCRCGRLRQHRRSNGLRRRLDRGGWLRCVRQRERLRARSHSSVRRWPSPPRRRRRPSRWLDPCRDRSRR